MISPPGSESSKEAAEQRRTKPGLSAALKEAEKEVGFMIFTRSRGGIALTMEGVEFLGNVRQMIQEMSLPEDRFILNQPEKPRFCGSAQHDTFTANTVVEMVQKFGQGGAFILNETQTHQILEDVKTASAIWAFSICAAGTRPFCLRRWMK